MMTIAEALNETARRFQAAGIEGARAESRRALAHAIGTSPERVLFATDQALTERQLARLACAAGRRAAHEPWALITGKREFWSLEFKVTRATLVPRPDSETLVETALGALCDRGARLRVLDLGTGSGCLLLALLSELPNASGVGVDASLAALEVAAANARTLGLAGRAGFVASDWGAALGATFDVILANPPYVATDEWERLEEDVRVFEPANALLAGADGLAAYRALAPQLGRLLAPDGFFVGEVGAGQAEAAAGVLVDAGLRIQGAQCDLSGISRCLLATFGGNDASAKVWV